MTSGQKLLWRLFSVYSFLYVLLYAFYILIITVVHSSYSRVSIPAVLLPFILLLLFELVLWKRTYADLKIEREVKTKLKVITILGSLPLLICIIMLTVNEYKSMFTTEKWLNNISGRVYMVDDLLNDYDLNGKTKKEVTNLLGTPTETEYFKTENNIVYYLGDERGLISIDSEWLVIEFDDNEKVKKYMVVTD
ncbi:outer membrane protein assembly factor BamE domain-containing protein [Metabacillus fastidiosus]|uniref:outer membrane protein assembly factor BamE domain-containing protein n=1 Tax=Metabacillus fastidiosus TaxID=1458 RepID=UPI002E242BD6|nr:outer membrane protein assembly factor BamE [Metabacillus fastidiosus]MED4531245.1 outer membrane protein assembly factor BamE [Metabacillus fastidiosus]